MAMSGGVDSSVAAYLLNKQDYEVVGITLHLYDSSNQDSTKQRCCAPEDIHDARRVCSGIDIPHYTLSRADLFKKNVIDPFIDSYLNGLTPNPCTVCNQTVKFAELFKLADKFGCDKIATGHYAQIISGDLYRATDLNKDQTFFLWGLSREQRERVVFPLGEMTKNEVRSLALEAKLHGASKGESQGICFSQEKKYDDFIRENASERIHPGRILNSNGIEIGKHDGVYKYTIGQRRGIGVSSSLPMFVSKIENNDITVSTENPGRKKFILNNPRMDFIPPEAEIQVRYRSSQLACKLTEINDKILVEFNEKHLISPGQMASVSIGNRIIGGGQISG